MIVQFLRFYKPKKQDIVCYGVGSNYILVRMDKESGKNRAIPAGSDGAENFMKF